MAMYRSTTAGNYLTRRFISTSSVLISIFYIFIPNCLADNEHQELRIKTDISDEDKSIEKEIQMKRKFVILYNQWQNYINKPEIKISSRSQDYTNCKPYKEIVKLGKPALPYLIEKLKEGELTLWKEGQFFLWYAIRDITGVDLSKKYKSFSEQEIAKKYIYWWEQHKNEWVVK